MRPDESPTLRPFRAASEPGEDHPPDGADDQRQDDRSEIPFPAPPDSGRLDRVYEQEIFGDERGGQTPKRPPHRTGEDYA